MTPGGGQRRASWGGPVLTGDAPGQRDRGSSSGCHGPQMTLAGHVRNHPGASDHRAAKGKRSAGRDDRRAVADPVMRRGHGNPDIAQPGGHRRPVNATTFRRGVAWNIQEPHEAQTAICHAARLKLDCFVTTIVTNGAISKRALVRPLSPLESKLILRLEWHKQPVVTIAQAILGVSYDHARQQLHRLAQANRMAHAMGARRRLRSHQAGRGQRSAA